VRNMLLSFSIIGHFPETYPVNIIRIVSVGCVVIFFEL